MMRASMQNSGTATNGYPSHHRQSGDATLAAAAQVTQVPYMMAYYFVQRALVSGFVLPQGDHR